MGRTTHASRSTSRVLGRDVSPSPGRFPNHPRLTTTFASQDEESCDPRCRGRHDGNPATKESAERTRSPSRNSALSRSSSPTIVESMPTLTPTIPGRARTRPAAGRPGSDPDGDGPILAAVGPRRPSARTENSATGSARPAGSAGGVSPSRSTWRWTSRSITAGWLDSSAPREPISGR